ncbi:hypothetical protein [Paramaledivibacter caminithermalis]|jgi:hypothetical protein|uniref:Uncharacterized protein n=1 Tax=Paramaledivibacter caminithermalis (strain DSM 15212 / CIP 107654 / DViRD3) TaxID=1121301 RepID=A0A1M6K5R7_PARC5|nr:hypothetical protein [Paramaledivibacter caminithermalis]SHJ54281.1 hypothetical protein SAMN02745912_00275 [Paramaledivibacter caminithermalis DSM 15212]
MGWYLDFVEIIIYLLVMVMMYHLLFNGLFWFVSDGKDVQKVEVINYGNNK